jgi:hypothetical protein
VLSPGCNKTVTTVVVVLDITIQYSCNKLAYPGDIVTTVVSLLNQASSLHLSNATTTVVVVFDCSDIVTTVVSLLIQATLLDCSISLRM